MQIKGFDDILALFRRPKKIYARFLVPHRVISTCRVNGGLREDITAMLNHQSCEPCNHHTDRILREPDAYLESLCREEGLEWTRTACLDTAANMNYASIEQKSFQGLRVLAVATGGVEANAGRAGDPAHFHEANGTWTRTDLPLDPSPEGENDGLPRPGTINIMVFINQPLRAGAMARSIVTATEAKTAVLQELGVNSRFSPELATGTGTDQIGIASCLKGTDELTAAGNHTKLGELLGTCVKAAVRKTLHLQNQLSPQGQRSVKIHIERFGTDKKGLMDGVAAHLDRETATLALANFDSINRDPFVVAAVAALAHLRDKGAWGILPPTCMKEIYAMYGAQVASAVSGDPNKIPDYRDRLAGSMEIPSDPVLVEMICRALAAGFEDKWKTGIRQRNQEDNS